MAEAIVSIVVGRVTDLLSEEAHLLQGVKDEIQQVLAKLMWMQTFLRDADSRTNEEKIRILVADIRDLAYDAEHVTETFLLKASSTIQWINTWKFSTKIKDVQRKMSLFFNCFRDYNIRSTLESPQSSNTSPGKLKRFYSGWTKEPEIFVGFDGDVDRLVGHLVNESDDSYRLISICGMGGLGKTTLAKKIYNHSTITTYFAGLAWVSISHKWQAKHVMQRILICLVHDKKDEIVNMDDDKLVENLLQIQQRQKCLIVLDDIWSTDAWDSIKAAFTTENSVSKLMLTSRNVDVAKHVNPRGFLHQPECLTEEQSWELLRLKALPKGGDALDITRDVRKMEHMGRKMVRHCAGLPLAIVILGGILVTKPSLIEWEKVYDDSISSQKRGKGLGDNYQSELFDVLVWSYNNLPSQLKPCFLYLGKFREDEWIEAETLYQLWIAEGIVLSSDKREGETMMEVAESYMGELVHKSMVQVKFSSVESSIIKFESCSLHDLMRDMALSQAKAEDFYEIIDLREGNDYNLIPFENSRPAYARQLVVYSDRRHISYFVKNALQRYRSMLLFNGFRTRSLHVSNFRLLRVFSLEDGWLGRQTVSSSLFPIDLVRLLSNLIYLRYLSVRDSHLLVFPSIRKLVLLQTLKLDTNRMIFPLWLSRNILGKLSHLRHLYLPYLRHHRLGKKFKLRFDGLSKLETLENFNTNWCDVKDLLKLTSLQRLRLQVSGNYDDMEEMMKYLSGIALPASSCLRYLALSIYIFDLRSGNSPDIMRQLLRDYKFSLQELLISGMLPELAQLFEHQHLDNTHIHVSLLRINKLDLIMSQLEEDPMPVLEKIPTLRDLKFNIGTYLGKEMVCSAIGFPKLTKLILRGLPNLEKWRMEEGSMPILSELEISGCGKLEELPEGLRFLNPLRIKSDRRYAFKFL